MVLNPANSKGRGLNQAVNTGDRADRRPFWRLPTAPEYTCLLMVWSTKKGSDGAGEKREDLAKAEEIQAQDFVVPGPLPPRGLAARTSFWSGYVKPICCVSVTCHSKIHHLALLIKPYPIWSYPSPPTHKHPNCVSLSSITSHYNIWGTGNVFLVCPWVSSCCSLLLRYHLPITDFSSALSVSSLSPWKPSGLLWSDAVAHDNLTWLMQQGGCPLTEPYFHSPQCDIPPRHHSPPCFLLMKVWG